MGYDGEGKRIRVRVFGTTKAEALRKLDAAKNGNLPRSGGVTVGEFVAGWLESVKDSVEPTTWAGYEQHHRLHIQPRIGGVKLTALDAGTVAGFVSRMTRDGTSAAMVKKIVVTLRSALGAAVRAGIITRDPADGVPLPKRQRGTVRILNPDEVRSLLAVLKDDRLGAVAPVAIDSGLRQGELFALHWTDFDPATGALTVTKSLAELRGKVWLKDAKTATSRRIVLLDFARPHLEQHRERMAAEGQDTTTGPIFCDTEGKFLRKSNYLRRSFGLACKAAGVAGLKFHELRHASASLLLLAGVDAKTVSSRLGHSSVGFTQTTYQHMISGMQAKAAGVLAELLSGENGHS